MEGCTQKIRQYDVPAYLRPILCLLTCGLCWHCSEAHEPDDVKKRLRVKRDLKRERRARKALQSGSIDAGPETPLHVIEDQIRNQEEEAHPVHSRDPDVEAQKKEERIQRRRQAREARQLAKTGNSPDQTSTQELEQDMPQRSEVTYFGAGPALLPTSVLETAAQALLNYNDTGLGIAEHSHRSALAADIVNNTKADLKKYLEVPDDYEVLLMQAGGSGEFSATVYNLVGIWVERRKQKILKELGIKEGQDIPEEDLARELQKAVDSELKLDYLVTGSWSLKASQEAARLLGPDKVNVAADARKVNNGKFGKIPEESTWKLSKKPAMIYYCDNETVDGVEFPGFPKLLEPTGEDDEPIVVADMSSNILSRRIPVKNFSLIFFGAQKNLGSTGVTVVIIKKSLLPPTVATPAPTLLRKLGLPIGPVVLDYATIAKNNSLYNTLSIFDVFVAGEVLKRLLQKYPNKVDGQEQVSNEKAKIIYAALDGHPESYKVVPDKTSRSRMNICFRVSHLDSGVDDSEKAFLKGALELGLQGLKGHRSVGGIRASNYNSIDLEGAKKLADYLESFAKSPKTGTV